MATKKSYVNQPSTSLEELEILTLDATAVQVAAAAAAVHTINLDNALNSSKTYEKLYDSAAPVVGTTAPAIVIPVQANKTCQVMFSGKARPAFAIQIQVAAVTSPGTAGSTNPSAAFDTSIIVDTT